MELKDVIAGTTPKIASQNLINPVKFTDRARAQEGLWRGVALDVLGVLSALFLGYSYFRYLTVGFSPWFIFAAFLAFSAISSLQVFLAKPMIRRILVILGEATAFIVLFIVYDEWQIIAVAGGIVYVMLLWGYLASKRQSDNSVEVQFFAITRKLLGRLATGILIFMILVFAPQAGGQSLFVPRQSFKTFFDWSAKLLNNFYPTILFSGSFGNFTESFAKFELQNNPTFKTLNSVAQQEAVDQASTQLANIFAGATGVAPARGEQVSDVIYNYIVGLLAAWKDKFQGQFIIAWSIAIFLLLRTVAVVFIWIAQFAALIVYEILLAAGFMHIGEASQTKEVVEY